MSTLIGLLEAVGRRAALALVIGVVASLVLPAASRGLAPFFWAIVVGTLTLAFVRIDLARAARQWRRPDLLAVSLAVLMVAFPVAIAVLGPMLGLSLAILLPLVLLASSPPLASAANFAFFMRLDAELAVNIVLSGTLIMPFLAPALVFGVIDLGLDVDAMAIFVRLATTVALAILIAAAIRKAAGRERILRRATMLDGIAALWMILFLIAIMDGVPALAMAEPLRVALLLAVAAAANFCFPLLVLGLGWPFARRGGEAPAAVATLALLAGNRNMGLVLTALPAALYAEMAPFIALYQIPIYLTPFIMTGAYRLYIDAALKGRRD